MRGYDAGAGDEADHFLATESRPHPVFGLVRAVSVCLSRGGGVWSVLHYGPVFAVRGRHRIGEAGFPLGAPPGSAAKRGLPFPLLVTPTPVLALIVRPAAVRISCLSARDSSAP
mgnify:CR=1 FL=1